MEIIKTNIKGLEVKLWEELGYHNIIGRSVYSLSIVNEEGGTYIKDLGDSKDKALNYYRNTLSDIIDKEIVESAKADIMRILGF